MSTPNGEPQNPYTAGQPNQGQNQRFGQQGQYQQSQYQQSQYQQSPYQQTPYQAGYPGYPTQAQFEGSQLAQTSMILGILSIFILNVILGPIAIVKANRAEREFNTAATVGKVTGWIGTIIGLFWVLGFVGMMVLAIFAPEMSYETYDNGF
ncbi:DUF4190 domain-containing protein [Glutamicibacter halophytocola]|uniref:DUF4190 domain-containing protein n=1 Tax=Glutamicibacter halophytocola TaxID=1933880 RepID=A0A5B8I178_9MICC|nr:DUF4190 domain-containing protein [Glutamicibacter halophytocola]QDY66345.1 DUF4190 domain-containing protein [Glutamicibacter halophytocola]UUX58445.1 DUF4190 domain-containing protein [Glutamicibacter halophytocola]